MIFWNAERKERSRISLHKMNNGFVINFLGRRRPAQTRSSTIALLIEKVTNEGSISVYSWYKLNTTSLSDQFYIPEVHRVRITKVLTVIVSLGAAKSKGN